jgi:hypothetical protein
MRLRKFSWLIFLALAAASSSLAAEITGKVRDASGDAATVVIDGDALPAVGDSAEIYFKVPGADEEISVASGKVTAVEEKVVKIKIEKSTGTIAKDQLARFKAGSTAQAPAASPTSTSSPSGPAATTDPSIVGHWVGTYRDGTIYSYSFNADQTFTWTVDEKKASSDARIQTIVHGKYRLNTTTKPNRLEIFDVDHPAVPKDKTHAAPFEFQGDSKFKMDLSQGAQEHPEKGFTDSATIFSRVTSPIVAPPEKTPAETSPKPKAPDASPPKTAASGLSIVGDWTSTFPDGTKISFSFKEDGTLLWVVEDAKYGQSTLGKYRVDPSTQPQGLELFDLEEGELKGQRMRGILEMQSDGRLKLDFAKEPEAPPLKEFTERMLIFSKATSPLVRSNKPPPPTPPPPSSDEVLAKEAEKRYDGGDYAGTIEVAGKAIAQNPKNARAYFYRGLCFYRNKEWPKAAADLEKAVELDPSLKVQDMINQAKVLYPATELVEEADKLFEREDYDGAIAAYTKAIAINPKNKWAFYGRGKCFFRKNDQSAGTADHEKVLALDPEMKNLLDSAKPSPEPREEMAPGKLTPSPTPTRTRKKAKFKP